jgi:hypothetical protein
MAESLLLQGQRSLMNDQPLLPFIEQLAKGSMRSFMSLPNGDFYSWHPDYFGAFNTAPYFSIRDIEILDGNVQLSDDQLVTHMFVVGSTVLPNQVDITNKITTTGVVNVWNAAQASFIKVDSSDSASDQTNKRKKLEDRVPEENDVQPFLGTFEETLQFMTRYGARPYVEEAPMIRSHVFETFYAFQNFMLAWSRQFLSTFTFTFMPEVYPGGIVEFPDHGLQMFVDEVVHTFDYNSGFTTQANLSAPAAMQNTNIPYSMGMIRAQSDGTTGT